MSESEVIKMKTIQEYLKECDREAIIDQYISTYEIEINAYRLKEKLKECPEITFHHDPKTIAREIQGGFTI